MTKYRAIPTTVDGIRFDSRKEAARYSELKLMERAKLITDLSLQPEFPIIINGEQVRTLSQRNGRKGRPMKYTADFRYFRDGTEVIEDVKGYDPRDSRTIRAIVEHIYGVKVITV